MSDTSTQREQSQYTSQRPQKQWFGAECRTARKKYHLAKKIHKINSSNTNKINLIKASKISIINGKKTKLSNLPYSVLINESNNGNFVSKWIQTLKNILIQDSRFKIYLFGKQRPPDQNTSHSISTKIQVVVRSLLSYLAVIISHHTPCYKSSREPKQHICTSKKVLSRL